MHIVEQARARRQCAEVGTTDAHLKALIHKSEWLGVETVPVADLVGGQTGGGSRRGADRRLVGGRDVQAGRLLDEVGGCGEAHLPVVAEKLYSRVVEGAARAKEVLAR